MILNITTKEFSNLELKEKKKVFAEFFGHEINEIVSGAMTNDKWGEYRIRHETYAYSRVRIDPTEGNKVHMTIYNFTKKQWQEEPEKYC